MNHSPQFSVIADFVDQFFLGIPVYKLDLSKHKVQDVDKARQLWDPTGNLDVDLVDLRSAKILAKVNFFKENPKHASKQRTKWTLIGLLIGLVFSFLSPFAAIIGPAIPFGLLTSYFKNFGKEVVKIQLANKNNWLYDPTPSHRKHHLLESKYPQIFKKGNQDQKVDDQFWGINTVREKEYLFNAGVFQYSVKSGKNNSTSYTTHYLFIQLHKELKCEFLLSPESKSIFNFLRSKEIDTESEEFNKMFEFSYNGKKDESALEIVKSLSPAVQTKLIELARKKGPFNVLFSKSVILFLFKGALLRNIKTNMFKNVEIDAEDARKVEEEISFQVDLGTSIAKYLN